MSLRVAALLVLLVAGVALGSAASAGLVAGPRAACRVAEVLRPAALKGGACPQRNDSPMPNPGATGGGG